MYMSTLESDKATRLRKLYKDAGLTQAQALVIFNTSRPKLFKPYSTSAWSAYFVKEGLKRHRSVPDAVMKRAEKVFKSVKVMP
jgi:hypothetical protein